MGREGGERWRWFSAVDYLMLRYSDWEAGIIPVVADVGIRR